MANEINVQSPATGTIYVLIYNSIGQVWQTTTSTFVSYVTANRANYIINLTQQGSASLMYSGNFPTGITTAGVYGLTAWQQTGGSPAEPPTDIAIGSGNINWDGSAILLPYSGTLPIPTAPTAGTVFEAALMQDSLAGRHNTAQGGTSTTITLDTGASSDTQAYIGDMIKILSGTGASQHRTIIAYNSSTKVATVHRPWDTTPDNTSVFQTILTNKADLFNILSVLSPTTAGSVAVGVVNTGAITDASITVPSDGTGQATTILTMILWLYQRFFGKVVNDKVGNTITTYQSNGTTVRTSQSVSPSTNTDQINAASS